MQSSDRWKTYLLPWLFLCMVGHGVLGCQKDEHMDLGHPDLGVENFDLRQLLRAAGIFTQFLAAAEEVNALGALEEAGPFTVFAPTDDALVSIDFIELSSSVILQHIVAGALTDATLLTAPFQAQSGTLVSVAETADGIVFNGLARQASLSARATNGVAYALDAVVWPDNAFPGTATQALGSFSILSQFNEALAITGVLDELEEGSERTILAPTDAAFAAAGLDVFAMDSASEAKRDDLARILRNHIVPEKQTYALLAGRNTTTSLGENLSILATSGHVRFTAGEHAATSRWMDFATTDGVIHTVDGLLGTRTLPEL